MRCSIFLLVYISHSWFFVVMLDLLINFSLFYLLISILKSHWFIIISISWCRSNSIAVCCSEHQLNFWSLTNRRSYAGRCNFGSMVVEFADIWMFWRLERGMLARRGDSCHNPSGHASLIAYINLFSLTGYNTCIIARYQFRKLLLLGHLKLIGLSTCRILCYH